MYLLQSASFHFQFKEHAVITKFKSACTQNAPSKCELGERIKFLRYSFEKCLHDVLLSIFREKLFGAYMWNTSALCDTIQVYILRGWCR